jgi:hypothetical protein
MSIAAGLGAPAPAEEEEEVDPLDAFMQVRSCIHRGLAVGSIRRKKWTTWTPSCRWCAVFLWLLLPFHILAYEAPWLHLCLWLKHSWVPSYRLAVPYSCPIDPLRVS